MCETRATDGHTWKVTSHNQSDQMQVTINNSVDIPQQWNSTIFTANIILNEISMKNNFRVLKSELKISNSTNHRDLNVTCFNDELRTSTTKPGTILGNVEVDEPGTVLVRTVAVNNN